MTFAALEKIVEERDRLRAANAGLAAALTRIAGGEVMTCQRTWTHADTVHEYQRIASAALAKNAADLDATRMAAGFAETLDLTRKAVEP